MEGSKESEVSVALPDSHGVERKLDERKGGGSGNEQDDCVLGARETLLP